MRNAKFLCAAAGMICIAASALAQGLTPKEQLGKKLFYDASLSTPPKMSCATCHSPTAGYADPRKGSPTSKGVIPNRFGLRNAPSAAYALGGPEKLDKFNGGYAGGKFWDGRADNLKEQAKAPFLNPLEMNNPSAKHVVNKVQMSSYATLFRKVYGKYAFKDTNSAFDCIGDAIAEYEQSDEMNPCTSKLDYYLEGKADLTPLERVGMMVFHGKGQCVRCHSSGKVMGRACPGGCTCGCAYTGVCACADCECGCAKPGVTACEGGCMCGCAQTGVCTCGPECQCGCLQTDAKYCEGGCGCGCAYTGVCNCGDQCKCGCPKEPVACADGCTCGCAWTGVCTCGPECMCNCAPDQALGDKPILTNHGYFNLGVPKHPYNPFYRMPKPFNPRGFGWMDYGLGDILYDLGVPGAVEEMGKFKVPSLRNCAKTGPYMHNGIFGSLREVVLFYNTRDIPRMWAPPEVPLDNVFKENKFGNLGLTQMEMDALVAYLCTMTDGYNPQ